VSLSEESAQQRNSGSSTEPPADSGLVRRASASRDRGQRKSTTRQEQDGSSAAIEDWKGIMLRLDMVEVELLCAGTFTRSLDRTEAVFQAFTMLSTAS
jgi:hypothetical protein